MKALDPVGNAKYVLDSFTTKRYQVQ